MRGLKNGNEDQIWLFGCEQEAEYMVVDVFDEAPDIGVEIRIPITKDLRYFTGNLTDLIERMTMDDDEEVDHHHYDWCTTVKENRNVTIPEFLKPLAQKIRGKDDSRNRFPDVRNVFCILKP